MLRFIVLSFVSFIMYKQYSYNKNDMINVATRMPKKVPSTEILLENSHGIRLTTKFALVRRIVASEKQKKIDSTRRTMARAIKAGNHV